VRGRYRTRTRVRSHLPWRLTWLAPKGEHDCGDHDWYRHDESTARCYHCDVGERPLAPDEAITPDGEIVKKLDSEPEPDRERIHA
jgi:hypothetical protein